LTAVAHRRVDLRPARGLTLHVAEAGRGPPLVLLHGWPEFWATWEPLMTRLADRFRLIAPDLRGFGGSDKPDAGPSDAAGADVHAQDLVALLDALGLTRVGLVGHDVGAYVMQRLAIAHPERVDALFFFNCPTHGIGARWCRPGHIGQIWYQSFNQQPFAAAMVGASRATCRAYIGHFLRHWSHRKDAFDAVLEPWVDNFMVPGNLQGGFNWYVSAHAGRLAVMAGTAPRPPRIDRPTRVLWGRHDPVLKAEWADALPDQFGDLAVGFAEACGHFVHYEDPDLAAAEVAAFFVGCAGTGPP
jgi:pimeloyl-ACP methyl ester carboxylesterase